LERGISGKCLEVWALDQLSWSLQLNYIVSQSERKYFFWTSGTWTVGPDEVREIAVKAPIMTSSDPQKLRIWNERFLQRSKTNIKVQSWQCFVIYWNIKRYIKKNLKFIKKVSFRIYLFWKGPDDIPWLLTEFMPYGDLLQILRSNCGIPSMHKNHLPFLSKVIVLLWKLLLGSLSLRSIFLEWSLAFKFSNCFWYEISQ